MTQARTTINRRLRRVDKQGEPPEMLDQLMRLIYSDLARDTKRTSAQAKHHRQYLDSAANLICRFLVHSHRCPGFKNGRRLDIAEVRRHVRLNQLVGTELPFAKYLRRRRKSLNSISVLAAGRRCLLQYGRKYGWSHPSFAFEDEWAPVLLAVTGRKGCPSMVKEAIARKRHICDYSQADQDLWAEGRSADYVAQAQGDFRAVIRNNSDLKKQFRSLDSTVRKQPPYRLPRRFMRKTLRRELETLFAERRAEAKRGGVELGESTEVARLRAFEELCGFAINVLHIAPLVCLKQVLTRRVIRRFALFLRKDRHCTRGHIACRLSAISIVLRQHPRYWKEGYRWILHILKSVSKDAKSVVEDHREQRLMRYEDVLVMVRKLRHDRLTKKFESEEERGWFIHDSLCFLLLALAVWQPYMVRTCRFGVQGANLFEDRVSRIDMPLDIPPSAKKSAKGKKLWQYKFEAVQTQLRHYVHAILLGMLVPVVEEYKRYRPMLVGPIDPGTLALSRDGGRLSSKSLKGLIGNLMHRYSLRAVLPSTFQAVFGWHYIAKNPGKFTQLASILGWDVPSVMDRFGGPKKQKPF